MIDASYPLEVREKKVIMMGLGLHGGGLATTQWLLRNGARVVVTDRKLAHELHASLKQLRFRKNLSFVLGRHRHQDFRTADLIVQNPGVPRESPYLETARRHHIPIVNETTLFFTHCSCPVIGVTGTRGKSSVSTLITAFLRTKFPNTQLAGNIRTTAMLDALRTVQPNSRIVLELSSWQLEGLSVLRRSPHIAVVTNILDDHLDRYPTRKSYRAAKSIIWRFQKPQDVVVLNFDNAGTRSWVKKISSRLFWFSQRPLPKGYQGVFLKGREAWENLLDQKKLLFRFPDQAPSHQRQNILASLLVARLQGISLKAIGRVLARPPSLPGRLEKIRTLRTVTYMNDTTATSPSATEAALSTFQEPLILIAGGTDKNLSYQQLAQSIRRRVKALVLLPGTATVKLRRAIGHWSKPIIRVTTMKGAVTQAQRLSAPGDIVLLSPGAASFGLFLHEYDRGDQFDAAVRNLKNAP